MILKFTGRVGSRKSWPVPSLIQPIPVVYKSENRNKIFEIFCNHFEAAVTKIFKKIQNDIPQKSFWKSWNLFFLLEFPEKGEVLPNLNWSRDWKN